MAQWDGRTKGGTLGYQIFIWILKNTNIRIAYFVLIFVAFWYFIFQPKKPTCFYFRKVHNYSRLRTYYSIYKNYYKFGQVLIDKIAILSGLTNKFTFEKTGEHYLHEMAQNQTGGILIGAHFGNWEIAGHFLKGIKCKANILMYDGMQQHIKNLIDRVVNKDSIGFIFIKENGSDHLFKIDQALKNKEIIAMHGDRYMPGNKTVTTSFLDHEAKLPVSPFYLASKYGVPVSYVSAVKEKTTHYRFYATKPKYFKYPANPKTRNDELKIMVDDYVREMEKMVLAYPLQWFNFYQFWNI